MDLYNREVELLHIHGVTTPHNAVKIMEALRFNASVGRQYQTMGDLCPAQAKAVFSHPELQPVCAKPGKCNIQPLHGSHDMCISCDKVV